jgi:hypothetical protein
MLQARRLLVLVMALAPSFGCGAGTDDAGSGTPSTDSGVGGHAGSAGSNQLDAGKIPGAGGAFPSADSGTGLHDAATKDAPEDSSDGTAPEADPPSCENLDMLYDNVTPEACDDGACAEQGQTSFSLPTKSLVRSIVTYAGQNGLSGSSFSYTVSQGGASVLSGVASLTSCQPGMEWCFFADDTVNQLLEPGSYTLSVSWPRMCATAGNGCQGFVQVEGCAVTGP